MGYKRIIPKDELMELYWKKGLTSFEIARIFNCAALTIINRMKEYNIKRRNSGPKRVKISKNGLHTLYIKKGFSSRKIARICHCEHTAVLNRLRKYNIPIRHPKQKVIISKKQLKELYIDKKLSTYKIAGIFNCTSGVIHGNLRLNKIKTRPPKRLALTKSELEKLYIHKRFPLSRIAKIYKCSPAGILGKMKEYKIPLRTASEAHTKHLKKDFNKSNLEKAYMIGFRIGDLGVSKNGNLIRINCGTTKLAQVALIRSLFKEYGPVWVGGKDKRNAMHVSCALNLSFKFLLKKHDLIPKWILQKKNNFFSFLAGYTDAEGNIAVFQGQARFRLRSYDKGTLKDINSRLNDFKIDSLFRLAKKAGMDKKILRRKDTWSVSVNKKESLLKLFNQIEKFMKHRKRKNDLLKAKRNVILRLKNKP